MCDIPSVPRCVNTKIQKRCGVCAVVHSVILVAVYNREWTVYK